MEKRRAAVNGLGMAYVELGHGNPIVMLHGNPTSSYLWRNIMPHVSGLGRVIAPDLIGMGDSDKLPESGPDSYRFVDHRAYLDELFGVLGVTTDVILVGHDWGGALAFDWAYRHPSSVKGLAYMETIVRPVMMEEWPEGARRIFGAMRSEAGEEIILEKNVFVERILPSSVLRELTQEEMDEYRRPYMGGGESRRPTLTWPRELPIDGTPEDIVEIVTEYSRWLAGSDIPKLFVNAEPGSILTGGQRDFCRTWPNQQEVTVAGSHFIQEDSPEEIGAALAEWIEDLG